MTTIFNMMSAFKSHKGKSYQITKDQAESLPKQGHSFLMTLINIELRLTVAQKIGKMRLVTSNQIFS